MIVDEVLLGRVVRFAIHWQVLLELHVAGRAAAVARVRSEQFHGCAGIDPDGVWRNLTHRGAWIEVQEGDHSAVPVRVPVAVTVDFAAVRMTADDGIRLVELNQRWIEAGRSAAPPARWHRGYPMPWESEADRQRCRLSATLEAIARDVLARDVGAQLSLFR